MQEEEKNQFFTELTPEESSTVSGGRFRVKFDLDTYFYLIGAGITFGNPGLTEEEVQFAWENSFVFNDSSNRGRRRSKKHGS